MYASGTALLKYWDTHGTHPYTELDVSEDATGKPTNVQVTLDSPVANVSGGIGQIFGSAIGRALAGNNQFAQLAAGTVAGAIGQKMAQVIALGGLNIDGSAVAVGDVFNNFGVDISGAAGGSVASFLTAELGTALGLSGYGAQLFNAAVGGYAGSVLNQVIRNSFNPTMAAINWDMAFTNSVTAIGGALGSILANQIVQAQTQDGAIGGQLGGAIGGLIATSIFGVAGISTAIGLALDIIIPGIGSLIGTILGTVLGDLIGANTKFPFITESIDPSGYAFVNTVIINQDGVDSSVGDAMAVAVKDQINAYLLAVGGVAVASTERVFLSYAPNTTKPFIWAAGGTTDANGNMVGSQQYISASAQDTVNGAGLELLHKTEVIGGDLLLKRAHANSHYSTLVTLAGDLQTAQDYEFYLKNRDVINALMAANPNTAFTAGWAATFARVNDLHLNQYGATDFLGGLVMGYLDSVKKVGLNFDPADLSVKHGSDGSVTISIHVDSKFEIPGPLLAFASQTNIIGDANGKTVQLVFTDGLAAGNFHGPASSTVSNGVAVATAASGNNIWFGRDDLPNQYTDTQASSQDVLIGGAKADTITAGNGWDFIDGGAGNDQIYGGAGNDILRGGTGSDNLQGGLGNDTYAFNRGDGTDVVFDDYRTSVWVASGSPGGGSYQTVQSDAGTDTLAFGAGIKSSDVELQLSGSDLIIGVKDPANPNATFAQLTDKITLQGWTNPFNRIEKLQFSDGTTIDLSAGFSTIEALGSTNLMQFGSNYYFYSNGIGPELKFNGAAVTSGQFAPYTEIGVEKTATGYQVAWKANNADQYVIWTVDNDGNYVSNSAPAAGNSATVLAAEGLFQQDLNGDGTITLDVAGSTSLVQIGGKYYLNSIGGGTGPQLKRDGVAVSVGQFAPFTILIGAEQTATGYDVAWKIPNQDQYTAWSTDSSGNYIANIIGVVSGTSTSLEALESVFHQDLNGNGTIDVVLEQAGSTALVQTGNTYLITSNASAGVQLKYHGAAVTAGQFSPFVAPIAVEQTATGYDVAWKIPNQDQYTVWSVDSSGNYIANITAVVSGTSTSLEALESIFHQDLNGNGTIDVVLEQAGSTALVQTGSTYLITGATSAGVQLKYQGAAVTVGQFSPFAPIAVEQTSSGYDVVWKMPNQDQYTVWSTDSSGNYIANIIPVVSGANPALQALESRFHQDLNGDGVIHTQTVTDFNDDGNSDLLFSNATTQGVAVWTLNGTQILASPQVGILPSGYHLAAQGDFDGDGKTDLLMLNDATRDLTLWKMNGSQVSSISDIATIASGWHFADTGDFNGDGKTDLFFLNDTTHGAAVWLMNGSQVMSNPPIGTIDAASGWRFAETDDFNGDGKTDLLLLNDTTHGVTVWQMDGTQVTASAQVGVINASGGWYFKESGDFNGDGKTDLLFLNDTTHGVAAWLMNGTQGYSDGVIGTINASGGWHFADIGDFNGDGKSDLFFLNDTTHGVAVWQLNGLQVTANPQIGIAASGDVYAGLKDINGDGKSDVLFENSSTHVLTAWEMNGTQIALNQQVGTINAAGGWHLVG